MVTKIKKVLVRASTAWFVFTVVALQLPQGFSATVATPEMSVDEWSEKWLAQANGVERRSTATNIPTRYAIVSKVSESWRVIHSPAEKSKKLLYLTLPSKAEIELVGTVNEGLSPDSNSRDVKTVAMGVCGLTLERLAECLRVGFLLDVSTTVWSLYGVSPDWKISNLGGNTADPKNNYPKWIRTQLGYDGVIVDVKKDFVLALTSSRQKLKKFQALVFKDSARKTILQDQVSRSGGAILQVVENNDRFAIFRALMTDRKSGPSSMEIGSKLVLERSESETVE